MPVMGSDPAWVLDTNVFLDWVVFADPACARLGAEIESARARLVTRADCRAELARVLEYPRLPATVDQRRLALARYDHFAEPFLGPMSQSWLPTCRDPDDQKFLELARDAGAIWLITKDNMLLKLAQRTAACGLFLILHPRQVDALLEANALPPQG